MTRSEAREIAVRICFALTENPQDTEPFIVEFFDKEYYATLNGEDDTFLSFPSAKQRGYITKVVSGVISHSAELDSYIEKYAHGWRFSRISRTAVTILKVAMYEVLYMPEVPKKVAMNEAVELAKRYETAETVPFVNGILGSFSKAETSALE